ncbi:unnamed protein product, partial [Amoebophrya sp. A25]
SPEGREVSIHLTSGPWTHFQAFAVELAREVGIDDPDSLKIDFPTTHVTTSGAFSTGDSHRPTLTLCPIVAEDASRQLFDGNTPLEVNTASGAVSCTFTTIPDWTVSAFNTFKKYRFITQEVADLLWAGHIEEPRLIFSILQYE